MHVRACAQCTVRDYRQERPLLRHRSARVGLDLAARTHSGAWRTTVRLKRAPGREPMHRPSGATKPGYPEEPRASCVPCLPPSLQESGIFEDQSRLTGINSGVVWQYRDRALKGILGTVAPPRNMGFGSAPCQKPFRFEVSPERFAHDVVIGPDRSHVLFA